MLIPCSKASFLRILDGCIRLLLQIIIDEYDRVPLFLLLLKYLQHVYIKQNNHG